MEVESHAGFRTYPAGHPGFWRNLQRNGIVPQDVDYDGAPRGRVTFHDPERRFTQFADKCIIRSRKAVRQVMTILSLPPNTRVEKDDHYRCPGCKPRPTKKQEEKDWDF